MADKQISDLTSASALTDGSLFVIEQSGAAKSANWGMMKNYIAPNVAPQYSASSTYGIGDYVVYNNQLYRCRVEISTAEAWTSSHWTATVLSNEVTGVYNEDYIINALGSDGEYTYSAGDWEKGSWAFSVKGANSSRLRTKCLIPIRAGVTVSYSNPTLKLYIGVLPTRGASSYSQMSGWIAAGSSGEYTISNDGYLALILEGGSGVAPSDYDCTIKLWSVSFIPLSTSEVSSLGTIFDARKSSCFTVSGSRLKELIDHDTNANVPVGNVAPNGIVNSVSYFLRIWPYGSYTLCEILRASTFESYIGTTGASHPDVFNWISNENEDVTENKDFLSSIRPNLTGDYFAWQFGKYLAYDGSFTTPARSGVTELINVSTGTRIKNTSAVYGDEGGESFVYVGLYNNGTFVRRENKLNTGDEYVVPSDGNQIRFCYGTPSASGTNKLDAEKVEKYFSVQILTETRQAASFIDTEKPLYLAFGASTTWGAVHHRSGGTTQSNYQYPIIVGNSLGLKAINMGVGSTGMIARTSSSSINGYPVNQVAYNGGNNNYMDLVYANSNLLSQASLITFSLAYANDYDVGMPIGEYDDYYPYDETGYHLTGEGSIASMIAKGATWFGCLNWCIKWISEHYPKAQLVLMYYRPSLNQKRTVDVVNNPAGESTGHPKYKLQITDPYPSTSGAYIVNEGLKTICDKIKIPFINLFEDGMPFNYYNSNVQDGNGDYVLFSTTEDGQQQPVFNVHPSDNGYLMVSRFLAGKILSIFGR